MLFEVASNSMLNGNSDVVTMCKSLEQLVPMPSNLLSFLFNVTMIKALALWPAHSLQGMSATALLSLKARSQNTVKERGDEWSSHHFACKVTDSFCEFCNKFIVKKKTMKINSN